MFAGMNSKLDTQPGPNGWRVLHVHETGSTNTDLMSLARAGEAANLVLRADAQTAGRGRLGRVWEAPAGQSLLCSLLFRPLDMLPALRMDRLHVLTQAVALAAADACATLTGVRPGLKWPNDVMVGERKLAGILAESVVDGGVVSSVVVGIGLNVNAAPHGAVCLAEIGGQPLDVATVFAEMLNALDVSTASARYPGALMTIGRRVRVELDGETVVGQATGISDLGHLIVVVDGGERREFAVGDVVHVRNQI